jgi:AcrR family transcriptional regulator
MDLCFGDIMGIKERKSREKESLRRLILSNARDILIKEGIEGLTMRSIANCIEYSQSKIYEFYEGKEELCGALCQELCEELFILLQQIPTKITPEQYLKKLMLNTVEFHNAYPHSDTLFTYVCFGPGKIPEAFSKIEAMFLSALKNLKSPYILNDRAQIDALNVIRCIFIGVSTLMNAESSDPAEAIKITQTAINILLRGWKK